jgi:hypothetical protein
MVVVIALVGAACRADTPPTEIVVTVDTTFGVPCTIDGLQIAVEGGAEPVVEDIAAITDADLPGSLVVVGGGADYDVTVTVTGMRAGEPFAVGQGVVTFDPEQSLEARFVLDRTCVPGPCAPVGVGGFDGLPERQTRRGCGGAGYTIADSLLVMRDACDMENGVPLEMMVDADEREVMVPLPFAFTFWGARVEAAWAGDNGYLGFGATAPDALIDSWGTPESLGIRGFPAPAILAFWDQLRAGSRSVCIATSGDTPDRIAWITWKEACLSSGMMQCGSAMQGSLTFSIALEETTDKVFLGYLEMIAPDMARANGSAATIGLTSGPGIPPCEAAMCSADGTCPGGEPCGYAEYSAQLAHDPLPTLEFVPR